MTHRLLRFRSRPRSVAAAFPALALASVLAGGGAVARAGITFDSHVGGSALAGASYANFDKLALGSKGGKDGGVTVSFLGGATVVGSSAGNYAAPWLSGKNNDHFGANYTGADQGHYLTTVGKAGRVILTFTQDEHYLGLLWGSTDAYNTLTFFDAGHHALNSFTGAIVRAPGNGDQGPRGTTYVNFTSTSAFRSVEIFSTSNAFEFDNVAYGGVPEPASLAMCGTALVAACAAAMRRGKTARP